MIMNYNKADDTFFKSFIIKIFCLEKVNDMN